MENILQVHDDQFILNRYPKTEDKTLRAWSSAEILALDYIKNYDHQKIHLFNDRFGTWNSILNKKKVITVWTYASQKKAILQNLSANNLSTDVVLKTPLENVGTVELALVKIPKSLELFELFLHQIHKQSIEQTEVVCCFMTKYFSKACLKIASNYFEHIEQSQAWKKARLLVLKSPIKNPYQTTKKLLNFVDWKGYQLQQYLGVFSANKVDLGTQFLLENLIVQAHEEVVLDVACGNGIISYEVLLQNKNAHITLVDDFNLAIASSKRNIPNLKANFICTDVIEGVDKGQFDLILSNPPFHFEYENNIEITHALFRKISELLKKNGRFVMVANLHLNYKIQLEKLFKIVRIVAKSSKFIIYECKF